MELLAGAAALLGASPWLSALLCALTGLVLYGFHPIQRWRYRHFPGPRPRWLVGNLVEIMTEGQETVQARWCREYGPGPFCLWMGALPVVMVDSPELARKVLVRPSRHKIFSLHTGVEEQFESYSIVFGNGEKWRAARNSWAPFFRKDSLSKLGPLMSASAGRLAAHLRAAAERGQAVEIWRELGLMTMDVVGTTAFGVNFNTLERAQQGQKEGQQEQQPQQQQQEKQPPPSLPQQQQRGEERVRTPADRLIWALQIFFKVFALGNPLFALFFLFPELERPIKWACNALPTKAFKAELAARDELRVVGTELVQSHIQHSRPNPTAPAAAAAAATGGSGERTGSSSPQTQGSSAHVQVASAAAKGTADASPRNASWQARPSVVDPGSFLALIAPSMGTRLKAANEVLGELWAASQAATFIMVGYETTANLLCYCIYLLARHPDQEARLLSEVDAFGRDLPPGAEHLDAGAFPFAEAVVQEALRLFPPAPIAVREAPEGITLGGKQVPGDAALQVCIYGMHRNPLYWRDPEAFVPDRFLPGTPEAAEVVPGAFLPFGDGSRKCIGYRFAHMEATLTLVKLYQQYTFRLLPGQVPLKVKTLLTMGPADGVHVTVHRRG